jgi:hypothetical protein
MMVALACLALALLLAGSGGALGPRSLAKQSMVQSLAAEGVLLAQDGVDGRTTAIFTREHGSFLSKAARRSAFSCRAASSRAASRWASGRRPSGCRGARFEHEESSQGDIGLGIRVGVALGTVATVATVGSEQ